MNTDKDIGGDLCRSHSARSDKEFCRVCPSNLNKKELENVYFTLLESNLELKTTINSQLEKIKILSTKVQRLTALQKTYLGKEPKDCCGSKAVINEQKECISELRRSNQCLLERVRQLNMRLCSAKQFLKRSPFQSTSRCARCSNKNVSMSALITKRSETNLRTAAASSQYLVKDIPSSRTADNVVASHEKGVQYDFCDENKCRNHIEELNKKNDDLQEELSRIKEKHVAMASQLERDMCYLRVENVRVRSDRTLAEDRLEELQIQLREVNARLGSADLRSDELSVELAIEKRKVSELETRLRAADMSSRIAHAIETHLTNIKMAKDDANVLRDVEAGVRYKPATDDGSKFLVVQTPPYKPKAAIRTKIPHSIQVDDVFKSSDDSGYTEINKSQEAADTKASTYINQLLLEKIADLQNQVNNLKAFKNNNNNKRNDPDKVEMLTTLADKQQTEENIISESSDSVITEKKAETNITATQQTKFDKNEDIAFKTQTVYHDNKLTEIHPDYEHNKTDKQQSDFNDNDKLRGSLKNFKTRSKEISRKTKTLIDGRKFSLQDSKNVLRESNLFKTGSLDENEIINTDNVKIDKIFAARDTVTKGTSKAQMSKSNNDIVVNMEQLKIPNKSIQHDVKQGVKKSDNNTYIENKEIAEGSENNTTYCTKVETRKDSDSSKGTYTIHKDNNVLILTKPKDASHDINEENKTFNRVTTSHKDHYTIAANVKLVLNRATSKDKLAHRRKSTASEPRTYVKVPRDVSPDSTECEISSMSDLPSERDERSGCSRSPGEEKPATVSESRADTTTATTDYGSLSEGELPYLRETTTLSEGEKRLSNRTGKSYSVPVSSTHQMEATLAAVEQELSRCTRLLRSHANRSLDAPGVN